MFISVYMDKLFESTSIPFQVVWNPHQKPILKNVLRGRTRCPEEYVGWLGQCLANHGQGLLVDDWCRDRRGHYLEDTSPMKIGHHKRKVVFQASISRCELSGRVLGGYKGHLHKWLIFMVN